MVIGESTWQDYTIECDVKIDERIPNELGVFADFFYAGVMGRAKAENGIEKYSMGFVFNLKEPPTIRRYLWVNQNFLHDVQDPLNLKLDTWYHYC